MNEDQQVKAQIDERLANRDKKFLKGWGKMRQNKWRYVLVNGVLFWGLPVAIISHLLFIRFDFDAFDWQALALKCIVFAVGVSVWQLW